MNKLLIMIAILSAIVYGQVSADLTIENQQVVGTDFFFDLYLTSTGTNDLYLGNADFILTFDAGNFNTPILSKEPTTAPGLCTFVPTDLTFPNPLFTQITYFNNTSVEILSGNHLVINLNGPSPSDITAFNTTVAWINDLPSTHRLGRFKVSGINIPSGFMNLQWVTANTLVFTLAPTPPFISTQITINAIDPPNTPLTSSPTTFQLSVSISDGWNMVSIPGLHPVNQEVLTWWSGLEGSVFKFSGGYLPVTTVTPGTGYWMKHSGANTYSTGDEWPASGINMVTHDPISANAGWNIIGGYENDAAVSGITTTPSGLQDSPVYGYSGGYQIVNFLIPGHGYWIKLSGPGLINIPGTPVEGNSKLENCIKEDWGRIIISDAAGRSYTLYAVNGEVDLNHYELPPMPPAGMFDVRFGSGRFAEDLNTEMKSIKMSGLKYPIVVYVKDLDIKLQDETGKIVNSSLKSGEEVTISNSISKLFVSSEITPDKYSLEQNYPNPFNPSTKIEFSIAEDVSNVTLTIYNSLGQRVAELVNSKLEAGRYNYVWNASDVATGLYIYELKTDNFVSVKKMILMK